MNYSYQLLKEIRRFKEISNIKGSVNNKIIKEDVGPNPGALFKKIIDTSKYILGRLIVEVEVLVPYVELN
jgi:hypothetical protein